MQGYSIVNGTNYGASSYIIFSSYIGMRNKISCASYKREITDEDACVSLRKEDGTYYVFDSYVCTQIFQKLNHVKRNVFIQEVIP